MPQHWGPTGPFIRPEPPPLPDLDDRRLERNMRWALLLVVLSLGVAVFTPPDNRAGVFLAVAVCGLVAAVVVAGKALDR